MRVYVHARPEAGEELVEEMEPGRYKVWVREPPEKGLANRAIQKALAAHLNLSIEAVRIVSGATSSRKVFAVDI